MSGQPEPYVCTWLYAESESEESKYVQVRGRSSSRAFQSVYWRCVAVFFATSVRHQPNARHLLFTNVEEIPEVDGMDLAAFLRQHDVEVVRLPLTYATPDGYYGAWRNQFYVFDIVRHLSDRLDGGESAILLDSDCVWIENAGPMVEALGRDGALTYVKHYPPEWSANDLTRAEMQHIASELLGAAVPYPLQYCGGELISATGRELTRLVSEIVVTWAQLMDRHRRGLPFFNEEGQTLSYIYYKLGYPLGNANPFIRRIWTGSLGSHNSALTDDHGLVVWHLPTEKRFGIRRLFPQALEPRSELWSIPIGRPLREHLGSYLGVPRNSARKKASDFLSRVVDRARYR
jgi:hypothetical protein